MAKEVAAYTSEDLHPIVKLILEDESYEEAGDAFSIAAALMAAESPEELLSQRTGELTHGAELEGVPFMLNGVVFRPGDLNPEVPAFAILDVTVNGVDDKVSTSGLNVMVACKIMKDRGWLPRMVMLQQSDKKTKAGYYPLNLVAPSDAELAKAESRAKNVKDSKAIPF